ncbi:Solute carrier family 28 member 3 [Symbiodinium microadriaticum]|uniref:Solute carrier family 28 member 3 n=1 Tax=Symbiodinium microadriaticum TaxID=2951 RepID=A0A1Q9ECV8_SYMMI|nr:Solute carrier family 28 member 3 [Symbiodinium microadriaticum]
MRLQQCKKLSALSHEVGRPLCSEKYSPKKAGARSVMIHLHEVTVSRAAAARPGNLAQVTGAWGLGQRSSRVLPKLEPGNTQAQGEMAEGAVLACDGRLRVETRYLTVALIHNASRALPLSLLVLAVFLFQAWDSISSSLGVDLEGLLVATAALRLGMAIVIAAMLLTLLLICWSKENALFVRLMFGGDRWSPELRCSLLIMKTTFGYRAFQVFGESYKDFFFAFKVLPVIIFFSSVVSACYHLGIIQEIFIRLGWVMQKTMGTGYCESLIASANIFLGQTEAPLIVKPFLVHMTRSEIHSAMTSGFASIAGSVMAAYILFGVPADHLLAASAMSAPAALAMAKLVGVYPETEIPRTNTLKVLAGDGAGNLLEAMTNGVMTGMAMAAWLNSGDFRKFTKGFPGQCHAQEAGYCLTVSLEWAGDLVGITGLTFDKDPPVKPTDEEEEEDDTDDDDDDGDDDDDDDIDDDDDEYDGDDDDVVDDDGDGDDDVVDDDDGDGDDDRMMMYASNGLVKVTFQGGKRLMGVPSEDCQSVGLLIGQKTILNEFVAYRNLEDLKEIIATYALCGFANFGSIGVQDKSRFTTILPVGWGAGYVRSFINRAAVGGFSTLEPLRKADFAALGFRAMESDHNWPEYAGDWHSGLPDDWLHRWNAG